MRFAFVLILSFSLFAHGQEEKTLKNGSQNFIFRISAFSNFMYEWDCMAGTFPCSEPLYQELWKKNITKDFSKELKKWQDISNRYASYQVHAEEGALKNLPLPFSFRGIDTDKKVRLTYLLANNLEDFRRNISFLFSPEDQTKVLQIVSKYWPLYEKWWKQQNISSLLKYRAEMLQLLEKKNLLPLTKSIETFYEAVIPEGQNIYFNLMLRPYDKTFKTTSGSQLENFSLIEVLEGEKPEQRLDVVMHELDHYFYSRMDDPKAATMVRAFSQSADKNSSACYGLLNEVLATAFGNGILAEKITAPKEYEKYFQKAGAFYNDESIDPLAKAMIPHLKKYLKEKKTLADSAFVPMYLRVCNEVVADKLKSAKNIFRSKTVIFDEEELMTSSMQLLIRYFHGSLNAMGPFGEKALQELNRYEDQNAIVIVREKDIPHLLKIDANFFQGVDTILKEKLKNTKPFVYSIAKNKKSKVYMLVAKDQSGIDLLIRDLAEDKIKL